jgi:hypothetical protein
MNKKAFPKRVYCVPTYHFLKQAKERGIKYNFGAIEREFNALMRTSAGGKFKAESPQIEYCSDAGKYTISFEFVELPDRYELKAITCWRGSRTNNASGAKVSWR